METQVQVVKSPLKQIQNSNEMFCMCRVTMSYIKSWSERSARAALGRCYFPVKPKMILVITLLSMHAKFHNNLHLIVLYFFIFGIIIMKAVFCIPPLPRHVHCKISDGINWGQADGQACVDLGVRTPISGSDIFWFEWLACAVFELSVHYLRHSFLFLFA
jgi:hypothetical protein